MKMRARPAMFVSVALAALFCLVLFASAYRGRARIQFPHESVELTQPCLISALWGGQCEIRCVLTNGQSGRVILWRDFVNYPVLIISRDRPDGLFCLYHSDTDMTLLSIDTSQAPNTSPATIPKNLAGIVCFSRWEVREADLYEWIRAYEQIKRLSPVKFNRMRLSVYDFGFFHFGYSVKDVRKPMAEQIQGMIRAGTTHWPIMENYPEPSRRPVMPSFQP